MSNKKKIALLNMAYDNNYGGNLQRYALVTILQRMGYSVEYLYIRNNWDDWFKTHTTKYILKQSIKQLFRHLLKPQEEPWLVWHREDIEYKERIKVTEPFVEKYIPHTQPIYSHSTLKRLFKKGRYDAIIAGSDQIWRKTYIERFGLKTYFLDFVPNCYKGKRVIYGASFGVDSAEYTQIEAEKIRPLFERLTAVSVREKSGMNLLAQYKWMVPQAEVVLDPTLLLMKRDYEKLIENADTKSAEGNMFCYILDMTPEKEEQIQNIAAARELIPHVMTICDSCLVSIEQWLRYIRDAKYVYTDSYHGLLFSLIFHKPFKLIINKERGGTRFINIEQIMNIHLNESIDWTLIDKQLEIERQRSIRFLKRTLI